jgi:hypothetical protein
MTVVSPTNPTFLVDGVQILGINDIVPGLEIAAFVDTSWQTFRVQTIPYALRLDDWWATMTNLGASSDDTLPRNLANLGIVRDQSGSWIPRRVTINATDLPQVERARCRSILHSCSSATPEQ